MSARDDPQENMTHPVTVHKIADGDVIVWATDGAIHIKTTDPHNDPVELTEDEATELAHLLIRLVNEI